MIFDEIMNLRYVYKGFMYCTTEKYTICGGEKLV
jgi:hypothetical protein